MTLTYWEMALEEEKELGLAFKSTSLHQKAGREEDTSPEHLTTCWDSGSQLLSTCSRTDPLALRRDSKYETLGVRWGQSLPTCNVWF